MLNVGNAVDSGDSRTGGVANLEIDGTLKGCLYVAGYSDVTVNRSGNVTVLAEENREEAWLQLRPHAVLTVNGKDAGDSDDGRTFAADEYQFRQDALNFIDGGTVNLNETQAYVEYIRMDSVGEEELLDVQNDELNVTDSTLVIGQNDLTPGRADSGMAFGKTSDVSNTMTVTLTRSSLVSETKTVNPLEGMTVNVDDSTVTATAVTNSGTFNVSGVSTLNIGSLDGNAIQLLDGTTLKNTGISGGAINSGNNFTFSGTNSLTGGVSVTATGKTVTNTGAQLTVDALSAISASAVSGGVLNISTKDLSGDDLNLTETIYHVVDAALQDVVTIQLNGTSATSVEVGGATYNLFSFADRGVYLTTETQETMYVNSAYTESSCDGHLYGYNAFNSLSDALKLNLASSIVTCGDVTETAEQLSRTYSASARTYTWADKLIAEPVTKSVTISDGKKNALDETVPVNVEYRLGWPDGADLCITALQEEGATGEARTTLTIEDGVVLQFTKNTYTVVENEVEVTKTASRTGRIWLGYNWSEVYLDPNCAPGDGMEYGSIVLGCRIEDAYQTWFGCNVTLTETARVTGSGQVCFRSGASGDTEAVVTLTGEAPTGSKTTGGNNQADAMISIGTGTLEFVSGKVFTSNTYIEGGKFQISDNHWHSDCALGVESENTTWAVSGELTSGVSGYGDAILLKSGSTLDVGTTATIGGLMIMTLENGSSLNVGTVEESAGTLANSGAINVRKGTAEGAVKSELTAKTLTNKGTIGVSDGSTVTIDGAVTNGGSTILVLPVPMHGSATNNSYRTITVTLTDQTNPSKTFTTTARIYAHEFDKVFDNVQGTKTNGATVTEPGGNTLRAVVEFTDPGLVDGTYDLTVVEPETDSVGADVSLPAWTYPTEVTVRNASITLESSSEFIGGAVTNQAGATIMVNDSSDFEAASLNNYGTIVVTGTGSQLNVPSTRSGESTINTGTIQVFNGGYGSYGSILNANGTITVTDSGSEFIASSLESTSGAHVNVLNDASATVNGLFANGGTLAVENAASFHVGTLENTSSGTITITNSTVSFDTLILSASTSGNVIMDWYSTMSFTGFDGDFENKLSLDMSGYVGGTYLLLDREGTDWTEDQYKSLLTSWSTDDCDYTFVVKNGDLYVQDHYDAVYVCYDGNDSTATPTNPKFSTVAGATAVKPTAIYITGGGSGESAWKADTQSILNAIPTVISDGKFNKSVAGGIRYAGTGSKDETGPVSLHITGGDFGNLLAGGDRVETGILNRYAPKDEYDHYTASAVTLTIDDGVFRNDVACGMVIMASDFASHAYIYGDTELVINGGEFRKFVYGGSTANKIMYSAQTHIVGNVSITINAASSITMNKLVGGSHQSGKITGDILLTLKGDGSNLRFVEDGEIWGGCTGDYYSIDESGVRTYVNVGTTEGRKRTLSFDGFSGALNCSKIRAFTDVEFIGNSDVELNNGGVYSFSDISSWTFENGSSLTGNFGNDFDGDTLNLTGFGTDTTDYALITDSAPADLRNVFKGFESLNVQLDDVTVDAGSFTSRSSTLLAWAAGESSAGSWCGGSLAIVDGVMTLNLLA